MVFYFNFVKKLLEYSDYVPHHDGKWQLFKNSGAICA